MTTIPSRLDETRDSPGRTTTYRVRISGHLDDHWSDRLGGGHLVRNDDSTTTLTVEVVDQAQLHGVLTGIRDLGVTLLSLNRADDGRRRRGPE